MKRYLFLLVLLSLFHFPCPLEAAATAWRSNEHGRVRLIAANTSAPKKGEILLGLQFQPAEGWYIYWKDPGEAGMPPRIDWSQSHGLSNEELLFPQPTKIILPGDIVEYGYEGETVYPVRATVQGKDLQIKAKVSYLTCNTSCVPYTYTFELFLPSASAAVEDTDTQPLIQAALEKVPLREIADDAIKTQAAVERKTPGEPANGAAGSPALLTMLLIAFVGGVILNVMPCVLPVLSIKLTGLLQHSGQSQASVAKSSLASAAGILVSFMGLALTAVLARRAGHAIGWGIQFQNPFFVTFLMIVVFLFALNLFGIFEINMPLFIGRFATTYGYHETLASHFVSGLFATLLATPCSAPFLGTAMGFALSQPANTIFAIFFAVGIGMALPYLLLSVFPQAVRWLPKPGGWMVFLKKGLGLLLLATALWLGWVLSQQVGHSAAGATGLKSEYAWVPFDETAIAGYLAKGTPVFVDVTADWCVTCKYNERFVLSDREVADELKRQKVVMMKADWTNRDPAIAAFLMKNGRAGIPFYAFYRPGRLSVLLSEFLTKAKTLAALKEGI